MKVEDLNFPPDYFDAAISDHTLAYVRPGADIIRATNNIATQCKSCFILEPIRGKASYNRFLHNYEYLFKGKMRLVEHSRYSAQHEIMVFVR